MTDRKSRFAQEGDTLGVSQCAQRAGREGRPGKRPFLPLTRGLACADANDIFLLVGEKIYPPRVRNAPLILPFRPEIQRPPNH